MSVNPTHSALTSASFTGRYAPDFSKPPALNEADKSILQARGLDSSKQQKAASIYADARTAVQKGQGKNYLATLDAQALEVLQGAAGLAGPIDVAALSEEGAENLLLKPSEAVDLDGDGLIRTGNALGLQFPPANASPELRAAWEKTTAGLDDGDSLTLSLLLSGASASVYDSTVSGGNFPPDYDWKAHVIERINANDLAKQYNSAQQYQKIDAQLHQFLAALEAQLAT